MAQPQHATEPAAPFCVLAIGASAGGIEPLRDILRGLPDDLPAAVLVVVHIPARSPSAMPSVLRSATPWPVIGVQSSTELLPHRVYVATADHHLVIRDGVLVPGHGPRENGHRPSVDVLFRSAARWLGPRAVGVVLSGLLDDGAAGLATIVARGGGAAVQAPDDALHAGMPEAALAAVPDAVSRPLAELPEVLRQLVLERLGRPTPDPATPEQLRAETDIALLQGQALAGPDRPGVASGLSCPDCNGSLFVVEDRPWLRFRCRVGHAWSAESLLTGQQEQLESALWTALRVLQDQVALHQRVAEFARSRGLEAAGRLHDESAHEARRAGGVIRGVIRQVMSAEPDVGGDPAP